MNRSDFDNCGFTHSHYKACIEYALENGYEFLAMKDALGELPAGKVIIMRHDEDLSLPAMYNLGKIENELGIRATYFIRLHAQNYNLLSQDSYSIVHKIIEMGHEIGFHYEIHTHPALVNREKELFDRSKSLMESVLGTEIIGMSYHEPARFRNKINERELPKGIQYEAYQKRFMDNFKYISDSSAHWREGCMCQHIGKEDNLYILTHGFWWFDKSSVENY